MAFTEKDRTALAAARLTVLNLEAKEEEALGELSRAMTAAGIELGEGVEWSDVANRADSIRDALAPFDSGYRAAQDDS